MNKKLSLLVLATALGMSWGCGSKLRYLKSEPQKIKIGQEENFIFTSYSSEKGEPASSTKSQPKDNNEQGPAGLDDGEEHGREVILAETDKANFFEKIRKQEVLIRKDKTRQHSLLILKFDKDAKNKGDSRLASAINYITASTEEELNLLAKEKIPSPNEREALTSLSNTISKLVKMKVGEETLTTVMIKDLHNGINILDEYKSLTNEGYEDYLTEVVGVARELLSSIPKATLKEILEEKEEKK